MFWDSYGIVYNKFITNDRDLMFWEAHVGNQTGTTIKHSPVIENWEIHYMGNNRWRDVENISELSDTAQCHYFASQCGWDPNE